MDDQVKSVMDGICSIFDNIKLPEGTDLNGTVLSKALKAELGKFMIYLAMSDGAVTDAEAVEISEMLKDISEDVSADPEGIAQMARLGNIYSKEFETTPAASLAFAIDFDNGLIKAGHSGLAQLSGSVLLLYKALGNWFINLDGKASKGEKLSYSTYIKMLEDYRDKNFAGSKDDVITRMNAEMDALLGGVHINLEVDETDDGTDGAESAAGDDVGDALKGDAGDVAKGGTHKNSKDAPASTSAKKGVKAPRKG
jgi:hypothetical protein